MTPSTTTTEQPTTKAAARGHRLPDDFEVTEAMRAWAAEKAPTCGWDDHESFCDYWRGVPGAKGRKTDWPATWRNWMRREHQRRTGTRTGTGTAAGAHRSTTSDRVEGWLNLSDTTPDTRAPHGSQMALDAPAHQEVTGWPAA